MIDMKMKKSYLIVNKNRNKKIVNSCFKKTNIIQDMLRIFFLISRKHILPIKYFLF